MAARRQGLLLLRRVSELAVGAIGGSYGGGRGSGGEEEEVSGMRASFCCLQECLRTLGK